MPAVTPSLGVLSYELPERSHIQTDLLNALTYRKFSEMELMAFSTLLYATPEFAKWVKDLIYDNAEKRNHG